MRSEKQGNMSGIFLRRIEEMIAYFLYAVGDTAERFRKARGISAGLDRENRGIIFAQHQEHGKIPPARTPRNVQNPSRKKLEKMKIFV